MRILFVHEVNYLTKPIFEMHELPEHLASRGHKIGFLHFPEGYSRAQIRRLGPRKTIAGRVLPKVQIELFTPWSPSGGFFGRIITAVFSYGKMKKVVSEFRPDIVVSFSVPTSGWQALIACKRAKVPYMFRALDVSHKIRKGIFSRPVKLSEKFIYKNADALSANNPAMLDYCAELGADRAKSKVDLPPLDLHHFNQLEDNVLEVRESLGIKATDRVIVYMGSFFYFSGLPEVVESMRFAPNGVKLLLVGGGEQDAELRSKVNALGLKETVLFAGFISFDLLPNYLKVGNVAINPMHRSLVSNTAFPNKVIQYLASGIPVVSTRLRGLEMTFEKSPALEFVESSEEVLQAALSMLRSADSKKMAGVARELVSSKFDVQKGIDSFESRINEVAQHAN